MRTSRTAPRTAHTVRLTVGERVLLCSDLPRCYDAWMAWLSALAALVAVGCTVAMVIVSRRRTRMALPELGREPDTEHAETTVYLLPASIDKATVEFAIPVRREASTPPVRREATPFVRREASTAPV